MNEDTIESEQIQNLFNVLTRDEKLKKSDHDRDKTFLSICNRLEDKKGD